MTVRGAASRARLKPAAPIGVVLVAVICVPLTVLHNIFSCYHAPKEVARAFGDARILAHFAECCKQILI